MELAGGNQVGARFQVHFPEANQHDDCKQKQRVRVPDLRADSAHQTTGAIVRRVPSTGRHQRQGHMRTHFVGFIQGCSRIGSAARVNH